MQVEPEDLREYAREVKIVLGDTVDVLKEGILPENNEDLVAIFSSETCAGALGGISSQVMSILLNDEKKTSFFTDLPRGRRARELPTGTVSLQGSGRPWRPAIQ